MPIIINKQVQPKVHIGIWHLTEQLSDIEQLYKLSYNEQQQFKKIRNNKRKREWLVVRIMLEKLLGTKHKIAYNRNGKPYILNSNINISVTHSKNYLGIIWTTEQYNIGIDIETISETMEKVKHKFLSDTELKYFTTNELKTICWSAKEAIYKIYETDIGFFDAEIQPFNETDKSLSAIITKNNKPTSLNVSFFRIADDFITYVIKFQDTIFE